MSLIQLKPWELGIAGTLILLLGLFSWRMRLSLERELLVAAARTVAQLTLIGLVLEAVFANARLVWIAAISLVMLAVAGREITARQQRRLLGWWGYGVGTLSMFLSSFALTLFSLLAIINPEPWYQPQYAIPLLGMMLGNTMTGIALALDRLTQGAWDQKAVIEQRLMLGESATEAMAELRRQSMRSGMMPMINAMAVAGVVSLPGMMTGQILAGAAPADAVKYQILIMFLISAGTGFGTLAAVILAGARLFDERQRLRLDRLRRPRPDAPA